MFLGALHLCHLGETAGAAVSTERGCPRVHSAGDSSRGRLGLLWAQGPGQGCGRPVRGPEPCPHPHYQGEGNVSHEAHQPQTQRVQQLSTVWYNCKGISFIS